MEDSSVKTNDPAAQKHGAAMDAEQALDEFISRLARASYERFSAEPLVKVCGGVDRASYCTGFDEGYRYAIKNLKVGVVLCDNCGCEAECLEYGCAKFFKSEQRSPASDGPTKAQAE